MIIANGTIRYKRASAPTEGLAGELDDEGLPVAPEATWSDPKPCQIVPADEDRTALSAGSDSPYILARYQILLAERDYQPAEEIRITNDDTHTEEQMRVLSSRRLRAVQQYEILCR